MGEVENIMIHFRITPESDTDTFRVVFSIFSGDTSGNVMTSYANKTELEDMIAACKEIIKNSQDKNWSSAGSFGKEED
jgi:transposase